MRFERPGNVRSVFAALALGFSLSACGGPAEEDGDSTSSAGDSLVQGLANDDSAVLARLETVWFVPSANPDVTTWEAYVLASTRPNASPTELLFVNHAARAPIIVHVDTKKGSARILAAPSNDLAHEALQSLLDDLAAYESTSTDSSTSTTQSLHPLGALDGLSDVVVKALLHDASKALGLEASALREAIESYTGSFYAKLNRFLREGVVPATWSRENIERQATTLTQALDALPKVEADVHRWNQLGVTPRGFDPVALSDFLNSVRPGTIYGDTGFFSTTVNAKPPVGLFSYATVRFDVHGVSGHDISSVSKYADEREVLFVPNTKFRVKAVRGEFVDRAQFTSRDPGPRDDAWISFYEIVNPLFGVSVAEAKQKLRAGQIPNIVVELEEVVP